MAAPAKREIQSPSLDNSDWEEDDDAILVEFAESFENGNLESNETTPVYRQDKDTDKVDETAVPPAESRSPLERFRRGYLWVSDLTRQNWCEQQLHYTFTVPGIVEEKPVMTQGSSLHLARELAVHDVVKIAVTSNEDIWAIKLINLLTAINGFLNGSTVAREVPIFGAPFNEDVFMVGLIDELQFDLTAYTIDLQELKTRMHRSQPSKSQQTQHRLQVMLYKKLFDDLVMGVVTKETVAKHLKVKLDKEFGDEIKDQLVQKFFTSCNLDELLDVVFQRMQSLTRVNNLRVEYVHQESQETLFNHTVDYSETELGSLYKDYLKFWRGQRQEIRGVDIEEAWKCRTCDFSAICDWRKRKSEEYCNMNRLQNKMKS